MSNQYKHEIEGVLKIIEEKPGFPMIHISNEFAEAGISLYGGQVLSFKPKQQNELLFLSEKAYYENGKAIKGGIPVCWPWFGNDPEDKGRPAHGFARNTLWSLGSTEQLVDGTTRVVITMLASEHTRILFPNDFKLSLIVYVGKSLTLELITQNTGDEAFDITQALHTYFSVENIDEVAISGLDQKTYLDKAKSNHGEERKLQIDDVEFEGEVDRIYLDVPQQIILKRKPDGDAVFVESKNNKTAVIWNPWKDLCAKSADLKDDDYRRFVCVETANAAHDVISLAAGESFSLTAIYSL